ncbi:hypothetical protein OIDMADRAFT_54617 [Oidiodendron maius Zn]|uniref:Uncharacterized protein n=1 Tax=Oidiodendron maius (strain Zn) TaxID=913774 RepID=A0A0C3GZW3_OIDMZ|nr:hypothetical protein OIDMADRAFT_54617 [Oidiodendron maius Zn]
MAGAKKSQTSLDSFFKKAPGIAAPVSDGLSSSTARQAPSSHPPHFVTDSSKTTASSSTLGAVASQPGRQQVAHSLTPRSEALENPDLSIDSATQTKRPRTVSSDRVVKSSDDEDSDSDASLVDIATLLQANRPATQTNVSTPSAPRFRNDNTELNSSPIVVPKYKFDLKYLASLAKTDDAIEASSKRIKALSTLQEDTDALFPAEVDSHEPDTKHLDLLGSVVASREDGEIQRVTRAIKRTEATLAEHRWYFFDTRGDASKEKRQPFPTKSVPAAWKTELLDSKSRYQTFVSGFAEDMVSCGKVLPDEIFLWMLDELCREPSDPLRSSYSNVLRECPAQVLRLVGPERIQSLFKGLGGSPIGTSISQKIHTRTGLVDPYGRYKWDRLRAVVKFLGQVARNLQQSARVFTISMLLRLSIDRVVFDNIDVFDQVQDSIGRLCRHTPDDSWEACCEEICSCIFECVEPATLRLQSVECVPSISSRTHDLKRRLAMCFYFNDISYSLKHSHSLMDLGQFITRLEDPTFDLTLPVDYRELTALVSLLDIAVDDARPIGIDLNDRDQERRFNKDIDDLAATIKDLMKSIGNPGAAFISKIEAKEALELVAQRISDTLRSKPKPRDTVFDGPLGRGRDDLEGERAGLQNFLSKMKKTENV